MSIGSLDELRAFVAVAEARSFTAAARRLGLTTNAVSLRVQRLEEDVRVRLFVRTTRSVAPTEEGRSFLARALTILAEVEAAEAELLPKAGGLHGVVRLALTSSLATSPFLERLGELIEAHPELRVQTRVTNERVSPAAEGLDVAVAVGQLPESTFVGRLLGRVTWVLAAAPSYVARCGRPRTPHDLASHECLRLLTNPPQDEWSLIDARGREVTVSVGGRFEADDSRALGDAAYAGIGIGVRPAGECARAESSGTLVRVLPRYRFRPLEVHALIPRGRLGIPRVAACLDILRAAVAELG